MTGPACATVRIRRAEVGEEVVQGRPAAGLLVQAGADDVAQGTRQRRKVGRLAEDAADDRGEVRRVEGPVPGRGEDENPAEGEDVNPRSQLPAAQLLGGHVTVGADDRVHRRERGGVHGPGDAEVDDARPVSGQDDVAGLEVPVDKPAGVNRCQPLSERGAKLTHRSLAQRAVPGHRLRQRRPGNVSGDHPRRVGVRIGVHHHRRVETPDLPGGLDLAREPPPELDVAGVLRPDELDRHLPAARRRAEEHLPHPAHAPQQCPQPPMLRTLMDSPPR